MLKDIDITWVVMPYLFLYVIVVLIAKSRIPLLTMLQVRVGLFMLFLVLMVLALPNTVSLSGAGYPEDIEAVAAPEKTLKLLQRYNVAMVRTTDVLHWSLFFMAIFFLSIINDIIKVIKSADLEVATEDDSEK